MQNNGYGMARMSIDFGNLEEQKAKAILRELARQITHFISSPIGFYPPRQGESSEQIFGGEEVLSKMKQILTGMVFMPDGVFSMSIPQDELKFYLTFVADFISGRSQSLGFFPSKMLFSTEINWGAVSSEEVVKFFEQIAVDETCSPILEDRVDVLRNHCSNGGILIPSKETKKIKRFVSAKQKRSNYRHYPIVFGSSEDKRVFVEQME